MKPVMNQLSSHGIPFSIGDHLISLLRNSEAIFRGTRVCSSTCTTCMSNHFLIVIDEVDHFPGDDFCYGFSNEIFWKKKEEN